MPTCDWFLTSGDQRREYTCIHPDLPQGQACDVGCVNCDDEPGSFELRIGAHEYSNRWIVGDLHLESRTATGVWEPLLAAQWRRMMRNSNQLLAQCFNNSGRERTTLDVCDCTPFILPLPFLPDGLGPMPPCDDDSVGPYEETVPSCFAYVGSHKWPPDMQCTGIFSPRDQPLKIHLPDPHMHNISTARSAGCTDNVAAMCWGHIEDSPCSSYGSAEYYHDNWQLFDWLEVPQLALGFRETTDADQPYADHHANRMRNRVLQWLSANRAVLAFDQIDSPRRGQPAGSNFNASLSSFSRNYNNSIVFGDRIAWGSLPAVDVGAPLLLAKVRDTGEAVGVEYVITSATVRMSLIPHRVKTVIPFTSYTAPERELVIKPTRLACKVEIELQMGIRVTGGRPADERAILSSYGTPFPVLSAGSDRIVFNDPADPTGDFIRPPTTVWWRGELGPFSNPPWEDGYPYGDPRNHGGSNIGNCCKLADMLVDLNVPAMETHQDNPSPNADQLYTGSMTIRPRGDYLSWCPGGP